MTEMQAAIGLKQLEKVDGWIETRNLNAQLFATCFETMEGCRVPAPPAYVSHAFYRFTVLMDIESQRDSLVQHLNSLSVGASIGPCPEIYKEAAFTNASFETPSELSSAKKLGESSLVLPVHPGMENSISSIVNEIRTFNA